MSLSNGAARVMQLRALLRAQEAHVDRAEGEAVLAGKPRARVGTSEARVFFMVTGNSVSFCKVQPAVVQQKMNLVVGR